MNRIKIVGACVIFLSLFWGAWNIDRANQKVFVEPKESNLKTLDAIQLNSISIPLNGQPVEIFNSREYVRIFGVFEESK